MPVRPSTSPAAPGISAHSQRHHHHHHHQQRSNRDPVVHIRQLFTPAGTTDGTHHDDGEVVLVMPHRAIAHLPPPSTDDDTTVTLCPDFAARGVCVRGAACPQAHASPSEATLTLRPHRRAATPWRTVADVPYARFSFADVATAGAAADDATTVTGPAGTVSRIRLSECLATKVLERAPRTSGIAPRHCAHWVQKGLCDYGADCRFLHAIWATERQIDDRGDLDSDGAANDRDQRVARPARAGIQLTTVAPDDGVGNAVPHGQKSPTSPPSPAVGKAKQFPFTHKPYLARPRQPHHHHPEPDGDGST